MVQLELHGHIHSPRYTAGLSELDHDILSEVAIVRERDTCGVCPVCNIYEQCVDSPFS